MTAEVVRLRETPPLTDVVAMLRSTADKIESGEWGDVDSAFLVLPRDEGFPILFGWGDIEGRNDPIIQFEMIKHWLISHQVERA